MIDLGWSVRHVAKRDTLAVVVVDVEVTATAEDFDRVVAEVRAAKGWPSKAEPDSERAFARGWDAGAKAERERIAEFVEQLPVMTAYHAPDARNLAYRYTSPAMVAARIRGEA